MEDNPSIVYPEPVTASPTPPARKSNTLLLGVGAVLLLALGLGGSYLLFAPKQKAPTNQQATVSPTTAPSPTPDETANWETYTNTKREYSFKYPATYKLRETEKSSTHFEETTLERDVSVVAGGGMGSGDALKTGIIISFTLYPSKDTSVASLKEEFGTNAQVKTISFAGKNATEVSNPQDQKLGRLVYVRLDSAILEISPNIGFESNNLTTQEYLNEYSQILSTFKFASSQVDAMANWRTYNSTKYSYSFNYPTSIDVKEEKVNGEINVLVSRDPNDQNMFVIYSEGPGIGCGRTDPSKIKTTAVNFNNKQLSISNFCGSDALYTFHAKNSTGRELIVYIYFIGDKNEKTGREILNTITGLEPVEDSRTKIL